jgi:hypothetical protein
MEIHSQDSDHSSRPIEAAASQAFYSKCQRCGMELGREKGATISFKKETLFFCDNCFKSVFKYDENMKTVNQLWEENGKLLPFIIRSSNWHRSSYMKVKEVKNSEEGKQKSIFFGDMYLRGVLKEQDRKVGKANHYIWYKWSEELAQKYKEERPPQEEEPTNSEAQVVSGA